MLERLRPSAKTLTSPAAEAASFTQSVAGFQGSGGQSRTAAMQSSSSRAPIASPLAPNALRAGYGGVK